MSKELLLEISASPGRMEFYYSWDNRYPCYTDPLLNRSQSDKHNYIWNKFSPEYEYSLADSFCNEDSWIDSTNSYAEFCADQSSASPSGNPGGSDQKETFENLYNNDLVDLNYSSAMKCANSSERRNTSLPDLIQNIEIRSEQQQQQQQQQPSSSSSSSTSSSSSRLAYKESHADPAMDRVLHDVTFNSTTYCQLENKKCLKTCVTCRSNLALGDNDQCKVCSDSLGKRQKPIKDMVDDLNFMETSDDTTKYSERFKSKNAVPQSKPCTPAKFRETPTKNKFQAQRQSTFHEKKQLGQCAFEVSVTFKQGLLSDDNLSSEDVKRSEIFKQTNDRFFETFRLKKTDADVHKSAERNKVGQGQDKKNSSKVIKPREVCSICGKQFASAAARQRHSLLHVEVRPYRCESCGIGFKLKVHLKKHNLYKHTDEYPCECRVCGKRFKDSSAVRLHERIHSNERPFQCQCGKSFKTRENLWGHRHRRPCIKYLVQEQNDGRGQNKSLKTRKCDPPNSAKLPNSQTSESTDRGVLSSPDQFKPSILAPPNKLHPLGSHYKSSLIPSIGLRKYFPKAHEHVHNDGFTSPAKHFQSFPTSPYPSSSTNHYLSRDDIDYQNSHGPASLPPFESLVGQKPNIKCFGKYLHEECISFDSRQWPNPSDCLSNFSQMNKQHWINSCPKSESNWKVGYPLDGDPWSTHNLSAGSFIADKIDNTNNHYKLDKDSENVFKYSGNGVKSSCAWGTGEYFNHSVYRYDRFPELDPTFKPQLAARFQSEFALRPCSSNVYGFY